MMIIAGGRSIESLYMAPGSRAADPLPQCPRRACLQHPANFDRSCEAGPADRLSAAPGAHRCALRLRRAGDGRPRSKSIAALSGAARYADPFTPTTDDTIEKAF